jgi:spermidine synthase
VNEAAGKRGRQALLVSVFIIASCGLAYELVAGALSSYLLGDSVTQFSTVIGTYLFAMGIGSWLSKYVERQLVLRFVQLELLVGLIGGFVPAALFSVFALDAAPFRVLLYAAVLAIGVLVGLEIPLVMRILKRDLTLRDLVSQVLTVDYLGALAVSLAFPLLLAPHLGLVRTGLLFGLLNAAVAFWAVHVFAEQLPRRRFLVAQCCATLLLLAGGMAGAGRFTGWAEQQMYADEVLYARTTDYQRIVITRWKDDIRLFLNNNLQFSTRDEYRYHEALVHPGLASLPWARRVLILGGGDGMAAREVLKYPQIESVTLVDLDPGMTSLFRDAPQLRALNGDAFHSPKMHLINADAGRWLENARESYDFVIVDFPDPSNFSVGKLYTTAFYRLLSHRLTPHGRIVVQATSPYYGREAYWTVVATLEAVGFQTTPYHALVPSFGEWGYILAGNEPWTMPHAIPVPTRFLTPQSLASLLEFPGDMARVPAEPNRLDSQNLVRVFEREWARAIH